MRRSTKSGVVLAIVATLMPAVPAFGERVYFENENFKGSHDIAYAPIRAVVDVERSGGYVLTGMDYEGEWAEYDLNIGVFGTWTVSMAARGDLDVPYEFLLTFTGKGSGSSQDITLGYTGKGFG